MLEQVKENRHSEYKKRCRHTERQRVLKTCGQQEGVRVRSTHSQTNTKHLNMETERHIGEVCVLFKIQIDQHSKAKKERKAQATYRQQQDN